MKTDWWIRRSLSQPEALSYLRGGGSCLAPHEYNLPKPGFYAELLVKDDYYEGEGVRGSGFAVLRDVIISIDTHLFCNLTWDGRQSYAVSRLERAVDNLLI